MTNSQNSFIAKVTPVLHYALHCCPYIQNTN